MADNRNNTDIAALDMFNGGTALHTVVWDPTEPAAATRPLLLTVPNPANPEILAEYYTFGFDQAKNVTELFDSSGNIAATYDHGPFGEDMASTGSAAALNPFRFSSEVWDATLGLVQYTFRPYNPLDGRFTQRDPIGEDGGLNLCGFVGNDPVNRWDRLGLMEKECGTLVVRALETSQNWWEELWTRILVPHMFIITASGERLDEFGSGQGETHWTATRNPITILRCVDCDDFSECLKSEYTKYAKCNPKWGISNNCQTFAYNAIRNCKIKHHTWTIFVRSLAGDCCDKN
jgi:RHS repeat-associated protein